MAAAAGVGFPPARVWMMRGQIVRALWLKGTTWWWRTSFYPHRLAYAKTNPRNFDCRLRVFPLRQTTCLWVSYNNQKGRAVTHTAACSVILMITCGFAHSASHRSGLILSARCAFSFHALAHTRYLEGESDAFVVKQNSSVKQQCRSFD